MNCRKCGCELREGEKYCPVCHTPASSGRRRSQGEDVRKAAIAIPASVLAVLLTAVILGTANLHQLFTRMGTVALVLLVVALVLWILRIRQKKPALMFQNAMVTLAAMAAVGFLMGLIIPCQHFWADADCLALRTCRICGDEEETARGHEWQEATCTASRTCSSCGAAEGEALGHQPGEKNQFLNMAGKEMQYEQNCERCGKVIRTVTERVTVYNQEGRFRFSPVAFAEYLTGIAGKTEGDWSVVAENGPIFAVKLYSADHFAGEITFSDNALDFMAISPEDAVTNEDTGAVLFRYDPACNVPGLMLDALCISPADTVRVQLKDTIGAYLQNEQHIGNGFSVLDEECGIRFKFWAENETDPVNLLITPEKGLPGAAALSGEIRKDVPGNWQVRYLVHNSDKRYASLEAEVPALPDEWFLALHADGTGTQVSTVEGSLIASDAAWSLQENGSHSVSVTLQSPAGEISYNGTIQYDPNLDFSGKLMLYTENGEYAYVFEPVESENLLNRYTALNEKAQETDVEITGKWTGKYVGLKEGSGTGYYDIVMVGFTSDVVFQEDGSGRLTMYDAAGGTDFSGEVYDDFTWKFRNVSEKGCEYDVVYENLELRQSSTYTMVLDGDPASQHFGCLIIPLNEEIAVVYTRS